MPFVTPLSVRQRSSANRKRRYRTDPDYRLAQINNQRIYRGVATIRSLDEMGNPKAGRVGAKRDDHGRFA